MAINADLTTRVAALRDLADEIASATSLTRSVAQLSDDAIVELMGVASQLGQAVERIRLATAGIIGARSSRTAGHTGLAQSRGHRNAASLLQEVTGSSRSDAARQVRVGESLFEDTAIVDSTGRPVFADAAAASGSPEDRGADANQERPDPWHAPLRTALMSGAISSEQHDAIRRGLGEPPVDCAANDEEVSKASPAMIEVWSCAAERLIEETASATVEDLVKRARAVRDILDPEGADARFLARYESRSFRMWIDRNGLSHGSFVFDDESAAWVRSTIDTALRPRRGGPRFVDPTQQAAAEELKNDPRSNEQLTHDLLIDVLRAGTLADAEAVLGVRQAGVRLVQVVDRHEYEAEQAELMRDRATDAAVKAPTTVTQLEDDGTVLPWASAAQQRCNTGVVPVIADRSGNPLNVGREQRLYTPKQRIALAIRDGGCRWNGCDRPASYCEAHHIDEWLADNGRTDVDRGILLCRFHHMNLHHGKWRITRDNTEDFLLHPPPGAVTSGINAGGPAAEPVSLRAPLPLKYAWEQITLSKRFRSDAETVGRPPDGAEVGATNSAADGTANRAADGAADSAAGHTADGVNDRPEDLNMAFLSNDDQRTHLHNQSLPPQRLRGDRGTLAREWAHEAVE